jgi:predicted ribosome quality control (RQC) complex YloA/Tae2 family protein
MDIKYIREWAACERNSLCGNIIVEVKRIQDSISLYFKGKAQYLQVYLDSTNPLLFITDKTSLPFQKDNRIEAFAQHLSHTRIKEAEIVNNDRIVRISLEKTDIFNTLVCYNLYLELIPHRSNIILTRQDKDQDYIIECWKYISLSANTTRQLLPGSVYKLPDRVDNANYHTLSPQKVEYPLFIKDFISGKGNKSIPIMKQEYFDNVNDLYESLVYDIILPERTRRAFEQEKKNIQKLKKKKEKKLLKLREEYEESDKSEIYRKRAELLKSQLHLIRQGMTEVIVTDYYSTEDKKVTIPLRKDLSPRKNMNYLFRKYRKGINGKAIIKEQIIRTEEEIEELDREIFDLENDISELKESNSIVQKTQKETLKKKKQKSDRFRKLKINEDWEIFIGRTNKENDELTCRYARPEDWWFHTRIFHGAHIILRNYKKSEITPVLINLGSRLAAYFSKAKNSQNVPVDYTKIRFVTKPHGSPPGYVIYKNQKTIYVDPLSLREASEMIKEGRIKQFAGKDQ